MPVAMIDQVDAKSKPWESKARFQLVGCIMVTVDETTSQVLERYVREKNISDRNGRLTHCKGAEEERQASRRR